MRSIWKGAISFGLVNIPVGLYSATSKTEKWDPSKYHDEYAEALMKVIEEKVAAGGKELPAVKRGAPPSTKVVDIVAMLQQSLNQAKKAEPKKKLRKAG